MSLSREPLQNQISEILGGSRVWKIVGSDDSGNTLILDSLSWEIRFDYTGRTDGQPLYAGFAKAETATSAATWLLHKFTYTNIGGTDFLARRQVATGTWDNPAAAFV